MADWKLHRREYVCADCARAFEEEEAYFSVLTVDEGLLARRDHCTECFGGEPTPDPEPASGPRTLIWWRTRRQPDRKRGLAVDFESIEALFLALDGQEDGRLAELRYLLSLLLMRKRRLKLVRVRRHEEGEAMVLRRPRRQEELEVRVFDLTPERMDALRRELERIVEGAGAEDVLAGPPPAPAPPEPVSSAPGEAEEVPQVAPEAAPESPASQAEAPAEPELSPGPGRG